MSALAKIQAAGFEIWLKDSGNIGIKPFDALTGEQLAYLKTHKAEIVAALAANDAEPTPPTDEALFADDRRHCRECRHLSNAGYCIQQRFRPVDDFPRRCKDFNGYPDRRPTVQTSALETPKSPAPAAPPNDPLLVEVFTPSGTPMTIRADSAGHAAWLRQMNPKPTNRAVSDRREHPTD